MKRIPTILLTLVVVLVFAAAPQAGAKWWKKDETESRTAKVQRVDRIPTMGFYSGTLNELAAGQWELDGIPLRLASDCHISAAGTEAAQLQGGASVVLMGQKIGGEIVARQVLVQKPDNLFDGLTPKDPSIRWSESDPTLGEGGPPES